jgi:hypothetical protein
MPYIKFNITKKMTSCKQRMAALFSTDENFLYSAFSGRLHLLDSGVNSLLFSEHDIGLRLAIKRGYRACIWTLHVIFQSMIRRRVVVEPLTVN